MRWFWIDRFVEFTSGQRAVATKNVTLVEEELDGYFPGRPMFPPALMIEGLAQTGGILVAEQRAFQERVVLAKVNKALFQRPALAGDQLTYTVEVEEVNSQGAIVKGAVHGNGDPLGEVELVFAHLDDRFPKQLFNDLDFMRILRVYGLFEVAKNPDGSPIRIPDFLLAAERDGSCN
jgi:3-hydroxyacyl-[acyl-carrier-protein] dehydratase